MSETIPLLPVMSSGKTLSLQMDLLQVQKDQSQKALSQTSWWECVTHPLPVSGRVLMGTGSSLAPHDSRLGWTLGKGDNWSPQLLAKERSWSSSLAFVSLWQKWSVWLRVNARRKTFHAPRVPLHLSGSEQSNTQQRFLSFETHFDTATQWLAVGHLASLQRYL